MYNTVMTKIVKLICDDYKFDTNSNPFAFNAKSPKSLVEVAELLDGAIRKNFDGQNILIRMIQFGKHESKHSREELIKHILKTGSDYYEQNSENASEAPGIKIDMYAARFVPFDKESSTLTLLEAFHKWKPKCEERPQYPVDIILIYDYDTYNTIKYKHPRYKVEADDAYKLKTGKNRSDSLIAALVIN